MRSKGNLWVEGDANVSSEILTAVVMKRSIFWDITPCSPLKVNRSYEGTCHLDVQVEEWTKEATSVKQLYLLHADLFLGLFFQRSEDFFQFSGLIFFRSIKGKGWSRNLVSQEIELKSTRHFFNWWLNFRCNTKVKLSYNRWRSFEWNCSVWTTISKYFTVPEQVPVLPVYILFLISWRLYNFNISGGPIALLQRPSWL
jgi:hypothetical protein